MAVRQITTRLAIDGEQEYKKQLAAVNRELGNLGAEMKLVDAQFKGQANSSEALRAKHDLLKKSIEQRSARSSPCRARSRRRRKPSARRTAAPTATAGSS